jgi:glycosyltransferase involved in cell wall biosynthesis
MPANGARPEPHPDDTAGNATRSARARPKPTEAINVKFLLASSFVPFIKGGGTAIVEWLETKLREYGHEAETVFLPFVESMDDMLDQMMSYRLLDLTESADRLVAFRPPAYLLRHPHKLLWFIHHFRAYYDLWGSDYCGIPDTARNRAFRARLMDVDQVGLSESQHVFTNSQIVSNRLKHFNGINSEVLYPPVIDPARFYCASYDPVIVCICRMEHHKRQHLLVEAMKYTRSRARLVLAGKSHSSSYPRKLKMTVLTNCLQGKVQILDRWISEQEKSELLSTCAAAAYLPFDEDSYGYPSIEAQHASKAILTTDDSGGVLELVRDGVNGLITSPDPVAIAAAMDRLVETNGLAERLGSVGPRMLQELGVNWDHVIRRLTA